MAIKLLDIPEYPWGSQYEWFAIDAVGEIAIFNTAGCGPIPLRTLTSDREGEMGTLIPHFPPITSVKSGSESVKGDFGDEASRGFYYYDWCDVGSRQTKPKGTYILETIPTKPLHVSSPEFSTLVMVRFPLFQFAIEFRCTNHIAIHHLADHETETVVGAFATTR